MKKALMAGVTLALLAAPTSAQSNNPVRLTAKTSPAMLNITVSSKYLTTIVLKDDSLDEMFAADNSVISIDESKSGNLLIRALKSTGSTDLHIYTTSGQVWILPIQVGSTVVPQTYELTGSMTKSNTVNYATDVIPTSNAAPTPINRPSAVQQLLERRNEQKEAPATTPAAPSEPSNLPKGDLFPGGTTQTPPAAPAPAMAAPAPVSTPAAPTVSRIGAPAPAPASVPTPAPAPAPAAATLPKFTTQTRVAPNGEVSVRYTLTAGSAATTFNPRDIRVLISGEESEFDLLRVGGTDPITLKPGQVEEGTVMVVRTAASSDIEITWVITDDQKRTIKRTVRGQ